MHDIAHGHRDGAAADLHPLPSARDLIRDPAFAMMLEAAPDPTVVVNSARQIVAINRHAEQLFGLDRTALDLQSIDILLPERLRERHAAHGAGFMRSPHARPMGIGLDLVARRGDGSEVPVEISLSPLHTADDTLVVAVVRDITERKQHEVELRESETRLATILEVAEDAVISIDDHQRITLFNQGAEHIFGYTPQEIIGQSINTLIPERFRSVHRKHIRKFGRSPEVARRMDSRREIFGLRKSGEEFPAEASISHLMIGGSEVMTVFLRDISARKQREEALRQSEERFAKVFRASPAAICICVPGDERFLHLNASFQRLTGYTGEQAIGQTPADLHLWDGFKLTPPADRPTPYSLELELQTRSGEQRSVLVSVETIEVGGQPQLLAMMQDITERKQTETLLERQVQSRTAYLNALLQFGRDLLVTQRLEDVLQRAIDRARSLVPDAERGALYLYDAPQQMLRLSSTAGFDLPHDLTMPVTSGLLGTALITQHSQIVSAADDYAVLVPDAATPERRHLAQIFDPWSLPTGLAAIPLLAERRPIGVMLLLRREGGGPFIHEARATLESLAHLAAAAIWQEQSRQAAADMSIQLARLEAEQRTLTERLSATEAGMLQAARLAAVGQLAASVAHEINNPLYAARNSLYLVEEDLSDARISSPYLGMATEQLARIARIIERMRDFYRPDRGELAPNDLNQLLEETLALADLNNRHGRVRMEFVPAVDLPPVLCNADQIRQVFLNLVLNAIDAMPDGGTLTVRTQAGATVSLIEIQDTGIGIPEEVRSHLFEPFYTTKSNGTGLGLSISAHIVTQHGGHIDIESRAGIGSTFRIVLPYGA